MSDEALEREIAKHDGDINQVYNNLQAEFFTAYNNLVRLFQEEKEKRELLSYYKRLNNAVLDLLGEVDDDKDRDIDEEELYSRIDNLILLNPALKDLRKIKQLDTTPINKKVKLNLYLDETLADIEVDDITHIEKNPEDTEFWLRRNYPNLVLSRFKPIYYKDNKLSKDDSSLDNLNNQLNLHMFSGAKKRKKQ